MEDSSQHREDGGMEDSSKQLAAIIVPIIFGIIFFVGVIGNSLVMVGMMKTSKNSTGGLNTTNRFIFNLAIADLLFLFFCVTFQAPIYSMEGWPFGAFMCVFCEVCQMVFMLASIYTMVALSLDRYYAIVHATSTRQYRTQANANRCLVGIWILSIGLGAAAANTRKQYTIPELESLWGDPPQNMTSATEIATTATFTTQSGLDHSNHSEFANMDMALCIPNVKTKPFQKVYKILIVVLGYVIPLFIVFLCYMGVIRTMSRNVKNIAISANKRSQEAKKHVTKIVVFVVIFFALHWFPYHVKELWLSFGDFHFTEASFAFIILAHCLSYANSCVNPIIYAFMSKRFRRDLKKFLRCHCFSKALVKLCSKDIAVPCKHETRKLEHNLELEECDTKFLKSPEMGRNGVVLLDQTVTYNQYSSCITCLTSITPSSCHQLGCLKHVSSFNTGLVPVSNKDFFCADTSNESEFNDQIRLQKINNLDHSEDGGNLNKNSKELLANNSNTHETDRLIQDKKIDIVTINNDQDQAITTKT